MALVTIVLFAALLAIGAADLAEFLPCDESNDDICKVREIQSSFCPNGDVCVFKQGSDASMAFDFIPNFSASNLKTMVSWTTSAAEFELPGFVSNSACDHTTCPLVAGQAQTFYYNYPIGSQYQLGTYDFTWKLWNSNNKNELCCSKIKIEIIK